MNARKEKVFVFILDISFCFTFGYFYIKLSKALNGGNFCFLPFCIKGVIIFFRGRSDDIKSVAVEDA